VSDFHPKSLPEVINTPYPSIAIGDLYEVAYSFDETVTPESLAPFEQRLDTIKKQNAVANSTFYYVAAKDIVNELEARAENEVGRSDKRVGVVHLDRYIGSVSTSPSFYRLNLSRDSADKLTPRAGEIKSAEEQFEGLAEWAAKGNFQEVLLIDDVLAFGNTVPPIVEKLRQKLTTTEFRLMVGIAASGGIWRGVEKVSEEVGIETEFLTKVQASLPVKDGSRGMAIPVSRDLTMFGGKIGKSDTGIDVTYPYFLPFSKPMPSLVDAHKKFDFARDVFAFNAIFIAFISERLGKNITASDLTLRDYGMPHSSIESIRSDMQIPKPATQINDYLEYARDFLEHNIAIIRDSLRHS
jgi:hypothetical protein